MSDPFEVLGLEPGFDVDLPSVEARHRELSRVLHPDRHAGRPASERRQALSRAIEVNEALRVLSDPVRRAEALLSRRGVVLAEGREPSASQDFLMEMLELREELSATERAADRDELARVTASLAAREAKGQSELREAFARLERQNAVQPTSITDATAAREANGAPSAEGQTTAHDAEIERATQKLGELRFLRRLLAEARAIEDELG